MAEPTIQYQTSTANLAASGTFKLCYIQGNGWWAWDGSDTTTATGADCITSSVLGSGRWKRIAGQRTVTANYTLTDADNIVFVNDTAGNVTISIPTAVGRAGREWTVVKVAGGNTTTLDAAGSETINGSLTVTLVLWESARIVSDGAQVVRL